MGRVPMPGLPGWGRGGACSVPGYSIANRRQRARPAVLADRNISEDRLGHLARPLRREMAPPRFDTYRHRGAPGFHQLAVTADLVADKDRLMEDHPVDRHRRAAPFRPLHREAPTREIHLRQQPPAEDVAVRVGVAGHRDDANERDAGGQLWLMGRRAARRFRIHVSINLHLTEAAALSPGTMTIVMAYLHKALSRRRASRWRYICTFALSRAGYGGPRLPRRP